MVTRDVALARVERLDGCETGAAEAFVMDEDAFRAFYDRTARALWAYLSRVTGSGAVADDLLQEAYYRLLTARTRFDDDAHRRNYLFRIATNLVRDRHRRSATESRVFDVWRQAGPHDDAESGPAAGGGAVARDREESHRRARSADLRRALARLKPRDREMLWLAYAEGSSHSEIAGALGLRMGSVRVLLFRARRRLAALLGIERPPNDRGGNRETR